MTRKIITVCIAVLLVFACSVQVLAEEFDLGKTGSISVTLVEQKQNEPIVGAELSVYYVATVVIDADGKLIYDYTDDFEHFDAALDDAELAAKLDAFVTQHSVPSLKITTDDQGTAKCEALPLGLYFIHQTGAVEGFAPCTPFLVTLPNETDGEYVYDVNASPKTDVARLTAVTIRKVWNTNASAKATDSVTVQLLRDGAVVETAILSDENRWKVTYLDMPESDAYSIQELDVPKGFTATYQQNGYVFTVTNTAALIQTGQLMWPIPVFAVSGMLFVAVGIALLQKKRKSNA